MTFDGALNLSALSAYVHIANGTTVNNVAGTGPGTINVTGAFSSLYFDGTQTFGNATINIGNSGGNYDGAGAGTVLTLSSSVIVNVTGNAYIQDTGSSGDGVVNQGQINQTGSSLYITGASFTNSGIINAQASGGSLYVESTSFANNGTINVSNGDSLYLYSASWAGSGLINLASGASLYLDLPSALTTAGLGTISNSGGTVYLESVLDNAGATLDGSGALGQLTLYGGTISSGTVTTAGLAFSGNGGTLSGVTFDGALNLSASNAYVHIVKGTTVNNLAGTGSGTINVTGSYSYLYYDNTQTVKNVTISLGNAGGYWDALSGYDTTGTGAVLTLGSSVIVDATGVAVIQDGGYSGDGVVNQGQIIQTGAALTIQGTSFTNSGTINAEASGGSL